MRPLSDSRRQRGQIVFTFFPLLLGFLIVAALAWDAGVWYFDHRTAQNQVDAAALAAVQELPDEAEAKDAATGWLEHNGVDATIAGSISTAANCDGIGRDESRVVFSDLTNDDIPDTVRVCVRRDSLVLFSGLAGVSDAVVSAAATARRGPADFTNVMPWAAVPFDRECDEIDELCNVDLDGDGVLDVPAEEETCTFVECPFGIDNRRMFSLKSGNLNQCNDGYCPSIPIQACGNGTALYKDCITGDATSSGFEVGDVVTVGTIQGNLGVNTATPLNEWATENGDGAQACDINSTPDPTQGGLDLDVINGVLQDRLDNPACDYREVVLAIICYVPNPECGPPNGSNELLVVGLAVYYVAGWSQKDSAGSTSKVCAEYNGQLPAGQWECGVVWGYLLKGIDPAERFNLDKFSDSPNPNPLAPVIIALIE